MAGGAGLAAMGSISALKELLKEDDHLMPVLFVGHGSPMNGIEDNAFSNYWKKLAKVSNPEGTVFDAPPGTLLGNISNVSNPDIGVLGFFEVSSVDTFRIKVFNNTLGADFSVGLHCDQFDYYRGSDQECFDCLRLKNSTIVQPHYWR